MTAPDIETETWADRLSEKILNSTGRIVAAAGFLIVLGTIALAAVQR